MAKPSINGIGKHTPGGYTPGGWRGVEQSEYFLNYNLINYRNVIHILQIRKLRSFAQSSKLEFKSKPIFFQHSHFFLLMCYLQVKYEETLSYIMGLQKYIFTHYSFFNFVLF